ARPPADAHTARGQRLEHRRGRAAAGSHAPHGLHAPAQLRDRAPARAEALQEDARRRLMSEVQLLIAQTVKVALIALLLGMMLRGKLAQCWSFTFYVAAILLGNALVTLSPDRFYTPEFWLLKQAVYDVLKMATATELAWRAFSVFPGAWRTARMLLAAILVASTLVLAWLTPHSSFDTLWNWQPSVATAAIWVLTAIALLVWHYQVPITEWQRAIALG